MPGKQFDDYSEAVAEIVRVAEIAARRSSPQRSKEARDLIALVGLKAGIPPRRSKPQPRKPQPAAVRKPVEPRQPPQPAERSWSLTSSAPLDTGEYEIVREISHAGAAAVYAARRSADGDGPPKFVIKAIQPPGIWSPDESKHHIHGFIAAAALQKRMADAHPKGNWAPIHGDPIDAGSASAYYVSDRFVRSADDLASPQREAISEEDLWRLVSGVVDGLEQLETTAQRPHGNLKAGNVLLSRKKGGYKAALADPLPDDAAAREAGRAGDLHNLGDLIRRLVLRDSGGTDAATASLLGAPGAWAHLGAAALKWREMCGALLEGGGKYPTFDDLRRVLKPLRPAHRARGVQLAAAAAIIVIILGILGVRAYLLSFKKQDWTQLCHEWDWYDKSRATFAQYADKHDAELKRLLAAKVESPADIAQRQLDSHDLAALADEAPPPKAITKPAAVSETRRSLAAIDALHRQLRNPTWHFWTDIDRHLGKLKDPEPNFVTPLAASLAVLRTFIADDAGEIPPNSGVDLVVALNASDLLDQIESLNDASANIRIAASPDKNPAHCDPFLAAVLDVIHAKLNTKPDFSRLADLLPQYVALTNEITAGLSDLNNHFEWQRIREEIDKTIPLSDNPSPIALQQAVDAWLRKVKPAYYTIPAAADPRQRDWAKGIDLEGLNKLATDTEAQPAMDDELKAQLAARRKEIEDLTARNDALLHGKVYVQMELPELTKTSAALVDQSARLHREIKAIYDAAAVPTDFLATIPLQTAPPNVASQSVIRFWYARKQALLIANPSVAQTRQMFRDIKGLTKSAQELDRLLSVPQTVDGQEAFDWGKSFQTFQLDDREAVISSLCDKVPPTLTNGEFPPSFKGEEAMAKQTWDKWQDIRAAWVSNGVQIEKLLTPKGGYYSLGDTPDNKGTLQERWLAWLSEPGGREFSTAMKHPAFAPAIGAVKATRYEPLAKVRSDPTPAIEDINALLAGAAPEQKWGGWQAAGKLSPPDWPLTQEQTARRAVLALVESVPDPSRKGRLLETVSDETQRRWMAYAKPSVVPATQPAAPGEVRWPAGLEMVASARALEGDFKIDEQKLDQKARYNLRLVALIDEARRQFTGAAIGDPNAANAKAIELWQAFVDQSKLVAAEASVKAVADDLELAKGEAEKAKKVGGDEKVPFKASGWTTVKPPLGETEDTFMGFEYRAPNAAPVRFEFIRVIPSGDLPEAFLSRGTVSVAQFNASVKPEIADGLAVYPTAVYEKDVSGGKIHAQTQWALRSTSMQDDQPALKLANLDLPRPTDGLPMQMIRASDIKLWIKALDSNLRLPRPEEWLAAVKTNPPARKVNLRDLAWRSQDVYFKTLPPDAGNLDPRQMNRFKGKQEMADQGNIWNADLTGIAGAPYDDGALMFLPADPNESDKTRGQFGARFYHLVGNVWQLVLSQDKDKKDQYAVVGGSALSPPELGWATPVLLEKPRAPYSDMGFRIAFDAPIQPPRRRLLATLQKAKFLFD